MNRSKQKVVYLPKDEHSLWLLPQPFDFNSDHGWLFRPPGKSSLEEPPRPKVKDKELIRKWNVERRRWHDEVKRLNVKYLYLPPDDTFLKFLGEWRNKRPSILHLHPASSTELMAYGHWLGERDLEVVKEPVDGVLYDFVWLRPAKGSSAARWKADVERAVMACKAGGALWVGKGSGMDDNALLGPVERVLEGKMKVVSSSSLGWGFR